MQTQSLLKYITALLITQVSYEENICEDTQEYHNHEVQPSLCNKRRGCEEQTIGLNNSLLNIMSTTQIYKNDIEDQITS